MFSRKKLEANHKSLKNTMNVTMEKRRKEKTLKTKGKKRKRGQKAKVNIQVQTLLNPIILTIHLRLLTPEMLELQSGHQSVICTCL